MIAKKFCSKFRPPIKCTTRVRPNLLQNRVHEANRNLWVIKSRERKAYGGISKSWQNIVNYPRTEHRVETNPCRIWLFISLRDFLLSFLFLFVFSLSLVSLSSQAIFEKNRWEHYRPHSRLCASSLENCGDELFSICSNDRSESLLALSLSLFFILQEKRNIRNH